VKSSDRASESDTTQQQLSSSYNDNGRHWEREPFGDMRTSYVLDSIDINIGFDWVTQAR
jgi:hypothetical protein